MSFSYGRYREALSSGGSGTGDALFQISRADSVLNVAPTPAEAAGPVAGDDARILLSDGTVEWWIYTGAWTRTAFQAPTGSSTYFITDRTTSALNVAPTAAEMNVEFGGAYTNLSGDVAVVQLPNNRAEYWRNDGSGWGASPEFVSHPVPLLADANATTAYANSCNIGDVVWILDGINKARLFQIDGNGIGDNNYVEQQLGS